MSADHPFVEGSYKWAQDTPAAQMVCLHMFLEGNHACSEVGAITKEAFLKRVTEYVQQASALIKHLAKNPNNWPNKKNSNSDKLTIELTREEALKFGLLTCKHCGWPPNNHFSWGEKLCAHNKSCPGYEDKLVVGKIVNS